MNFTGKITDFRLTQQDAINRCIKFTLLLIFFFGLNSLALSAQESNTLLPKKKTVTYNGHSIDVQVYENQDKPTIILLHGFPDNRHLYDLFIPQLTNEFERLGNRE